MLTLKIGIQTASLRLPLRKALHTAAQLGATAIEIDARDDLRPADLSETAARQFRKLLKDLNLKLAAVRFRTRRGYDVADDLDRRITATKQAMNMAYALGSSVVINQIGPIPEPPAAGEVNDAWTRMTEAVVDMARYGDRAGAFLTAGTGTESGTRMVEFIQSLPAGALRVNFDPGQLIVNGFSAAEAVRELGPYIAHVHANDAVRDLAQGRGLNVPLGRGAVDYEDLLAHLENHEYRGYLTITRDGADDPVGEIGQAVEYLKNLA
ncbi:MAG: sugar phosphate isomerase/epimerase family protein [Pirellulales bacterium]